MGNLETMQLIVVIAHSNQGRWTSLKTVSITATVIAYESSWRFERLPFGVRAKA